MTFPSHTACAHVMGTEPRPGSSGTVQASCASSNRLSAWNGQVACSTQTPSSKFSIVSAPSRFRPHAAGEKLADVTSTRRDMPLLNE